MTEKKFRFLEQLEDDLRDAAARERVAGEGKRSRKASRSASGDRHNWTRWVAAAVVVLVLAGGIGGFVQLQQNRHTYNLAARSLGIANGTGGTTTGKAFSPPGAPTWQAAGGAIQGSSTDQLGQVQYGDIAAVPSAAPAPDSYTSYNTGSLGAGAAASTPMKQADISKIVRNGVVTIELPAGGFSKAETRVDGLAKAAGGYVVSSSARGSGSGTFVLRIPAKNFDAVMGQLAPWPGGKVLWRNTTGQDVTAQYIDSSASLQILKAQKAATLRYLKNAGSLSQAIQFRNQAFQIQGEIDKLQGQLNYLKDQVALATITVNLRETGAPATHKPAPVTKPSLVRAWDRAVSGFLGVLSAVIVGLGFLVPIGILALLIGVPLMALTRKRRAASSTS